MTALGSAIYFDHELASNPGPLEALIRWLAAVGPLTQSYVFVESRRRAQPGMVLDVQSLLNRITAGELFSVSVRSPDPSPDSDALELYVHTSPVGSISENHPPLKARYELRLVVGATTLQRLGAASVVARIVEFADKVAAMAGVVFWAETAILAEGLAACNGGSLSPSQRERINEISYWEPRWGTVIRGPEWGTFLGPTHVRTLGGVTRIVQESGAEVQVLRSGGLFLRATSYDQLPVDACPPDLSRFLEPVMGTRKS